MVEVEKGFLEVAFLSMTEEQRAEIKTLLVNNQKENYGKHNIERKTVEGSEVECI